MCSDRARNRTVETATFAMFTDRDDGRSLSTGAGLSADALLSGKASPPAEASPSSEAYPVIVSPGPINPLSGLEDVVRDRPFVAIRFPNALYVVIGPLDGGPDDQASRAYVSSLHRLAAVLGV